MVKQKSKTMEASFPPAYWLLIVISSKLLLARYLHLARLAHRPTLKPETLTKVA